MAPDARRQLVAGVEDELALGGTRYRFVKLARAGSADVRTAPPEDPIARALLAWCQDTPAGQGPTLDAMLTPRVVSELHRALADRTGELVARGDVPRSWEDPGRLPWPELLHLIIACISAGASDPSVRRGGIATLVPRLARKLRHVVDDFSSTPALALRMLRPDDRPRSCRHYAPVLPLIFDAVRRAAGREEPVFALEVTGRPFLTSQLRHSWNWFVDVSRAEIVAIDLHTALKDRTAAQDVFSVWLDWMEMANVSAFLNGLFYRAGTQPGAAAVAVLAAMPRLIDPATPRGQSLLYRLAQQPGLHKRARARIVHELERRGFAAVIPAWRQDIERALANPSGRLLASLMFADAQLEMLDAIGLSTN